MQSQPPPAPITLETPPAAGKEFSLFEFLLVFGRHKGLVFGLALASGALAYAASYLLPVEYKASVTIATSKETPAALLRSVAESDAVRDRLVERFKLSDRYGVEPGPPAQAAFGRRVETRLGRDQLLSITTVDTDPAFAAKLADAVGNETITIAHAARLSATSQLLNRLRIQVEQLEQKAIAASQVLTREGVKDWRTALPGNEAVVLGQVAELQAEVNQNSSYTGSAETTMLFMQERLSSLQRGAGERRGPQGLVVSPAAFDAIKDQFYFAALRKRLALQMEIVQRQMADEIKLASPAPIPLVKDSPKRSLIAAGAAALGLLLGLVIAFVRESMLRDTTGRMGALRAAWGRRAA